MASVDSPATAGVDAKRRGSATARRQLVIGTLTRELDTLSFETPASRFAAMLAEEPKHLIVSADIDGIVSASMLAQVSGWRAVALVIKSDSVLVHPSMAEALDFGRCFGVDVFSTYIPNVSNHVTLWGRKRPESSEEAGAIARAFDRAVVERSATTLVLNPSHWARVEGGTTADGEPLALQYRYPLGTAQFLLAVLEVIGRSPRMFDRDFLPWLIANCDGGLDSIRTYGWNARVWWPSLAAAVGPSSLSELVYQTAANQRPNEFEDVVHRLRSEGTGVSGSVADSLTDKWNLASPTRYHIAKVTEWLTAVSGWADPFFGGAASLDGWVSIDISQRGILPTTGLPEGGKPMDERLEAFKTHLRSSLAAFHTGFASYREGTRLVWNLPWDGTAVPPSSPLPPELV